MEKPALKAAAAFSIGILISHFTHITPSYIGIILIGSCVVYLIAGIATKRRTPQWVLEGTTLIIIGGAGILWYGVRTNIFSENHIRNFGSPPDIVGIVSQIIKEPDVREGHTILECRVESLFIGVSSKPVHTVGKIRINVKYPTEEFEYGDIIESYGKLWFHEFPRNHGSFDYGAWLKQSDIYAQMNVYAPQEIRVVGKRCGNPVISKIALPIKKYIRNTIDEHLGWIQGPFLRVIIVGDRGIVPKRIYEYFQNTGVVHLMAISGIHVGIIAVIIFTIMSIFRVPLIPNQIITSIFLILYACITDLRPPIVRATIMSIFAMIALTTERDSDIFNVMSFAGLFILFINPQTLFDVGFILSFGGVFWGVYLYSKVYNLIFRVIRVEGAGVLTKLLAQLHRRGIQLFTFSLCVQLGITPIVLYNFFKLPIISVIANLFVVPLTGACISLTFIMSLLNLLPWQMPTYIFVSATWATTTFTIKIVEWLDKIPYAYIWVGKPSILVISFYYLLLVSIVNFPISIVARKVFIYGGLIVLNLLVWSNIYHIAHPRLRTTYLDVSHGDCTFIDLPNGQKILIDAGPSKRDWDAGTYVLAPFLRSKGISEIDLVIVTNPKSYRIGGMSYLIENFKVKKVICPTVLHQSWTWLNLLKLLDRKGINSKIILADNISVKLEYNNISFLFPGEDVTTELPHPTHFTVLSIPKHGSKKCFSNQWARSISPKLAIISCGKNLWNEPNTNVIDEYKATGAKVLRTDNEGAITVTTDGSTLQIETMRQLYSQFKHKLTLFGAFLCVPSYTVEWRKQFYVRYTELCGYRNNIA